MFERFTERARQAVVMAQDEARLLKHNYIGTEHLLLGLLREEQGIAARVLDSLDITLEEVRAQVARIVGEGEELTTGQIPFTPRAKKVLELSLREAMALGHNYIGTEHILLGLARENEGVASRILLDFDVDAEVLRDAVIGTLGGTLGGTAEAVAHFAPESPPFTPEVGEELERIRTEKERLIEEADFEGAAVARDRERRLTTAAVAFNAAWNARDVPAPQASTQVMRPSPGAPPRLPRRMPRRTYTYSDSPPRRDWLPVVAAAVWASFGLAVGVLLGWAIWG